MRRYYEAHVLIVPQGRSAVAVEDAMRELGLDGVLTVAEATDGGWEVRPLGKHGWAAPFRATRVGDTVVEADIVILLAADLAEVRAELCREVTEAARRNGSLVAALVVKPTGHNTFSGNSAMAELRTAVDMLVAVRGPGLAAPFLDVLRGGLRDRLAAG